MSTADLPPEVRRTLAQQFFDFKTFGIIGLAIAFVIGQAACRLVIALVNDIIDPIIYVDRKNKSFLNTATSSDVQTS